MDKPPHSQFANRLFQRLGQRLVELAQPQPGATVLAIGASTAVITRCAAAKVGATGQAIGIEPLPDLGAQVCQNANVTGYANVEWRPGILELLPFADETVDTLLSAAVFLLPDLLTALRAWRRVLKPGGVIAFSGYSGQAFQPLLQLYRTALIGYDLPLPPLLDPFVRQQFSELEQYSDLLRNASFTPSDVRGEQLGYYLADATKWWAILEQSGLHHPLAQLTPTALAQFKAAHLAAVARLATPQGIWLNGAVIFAVGRK